MDGKLHPDFQTLAPDYQNTLLLLHARHNRYVQPYQRLTGGRSYGQPAPLVGRAARILAQTPPGNPRESVRQPQRRHEKTLAQRRDGSADRSAATRRGAFGRGLLLRSRRAGPGLGHGERRAAVLAADELPAGVFGDLERLPALQTRADDRNSCHVSPRYGTGFRGFCLKQARERPAPPL